MKKTCIALTLILSFSTYANENLPAECRDLFNTLDELESLPKVPDLELPSKEDINQMKTDILESVEKNSQTVVEECKQNNGVLVSTINFVKAMSNLPQKK